MFCHVLMYSSVFKKKIKINDCYEGLLRMRMNPVNQSECVLVVKIHWTKMYIYEQNILYIYLQFSKFQKSYFVNFCLIDPFSIIMVLPVCRTNSYTLPKFYLDNYMT